MRDDDTRQDPPSVQGTDDGGNAYPTIIDSRHGVYHEGGMTLRDWFAGQFLATVGDYCCREDAQVGASLAYEWADRMIEAR